jgi:alcohol dehydrogenase (cytochrome c)
MRTLTNIPLALITATIALPACLSAQGVTKDMLLHPPADSWPTYNGDYTAKRYSTLDQINKSNVATLTLAWTYKANRSTDGPNVGGEHKPGDPIFLNVNNTTFKCAALLVDGVLYATMPDHAWAIDARTGREIWHYYWNSYGGHHDGERGFGMYGNWLFMETADNYVVSLEAATGKERWHRKIADVKQGYFSTSAPLIVGNHVIVGTGGDNLDVQGFLKSLDPETGDLQWTWYTSPQNPGDAGYDTWPDDYSRKHGGGMTWQPPSYDPELNLVYVPTGNPNPVGAGQSRKGDNLFSCSVVALNPDTGKMVWYFQSSPHDTHDWDSTQAAVLVDGTWEGKPRKMLIQGTRNGYFFVLDRTNGKNLLTKTLVDPQYVTWSKGVAANGQPIPNPEKDPSVDGVLVGPGSATNWQPPSFSPQTGLFYVGTSEGLSMSYLTDTDERPEGYGFSGGAGAGGGRSGLRAIDYHTGQMKWFHPGGGAQGLLSTAGGLLFGGDGAQHFIAFDAATGKPLWHTALLANHTNGPQTYLLDGKQFVLVGAGDTLYAFTLNN